MRRHVDIVDACDRQVAGNNMPSAWGSIMQPMAGTSIPPMSAAGGSASASSAAFRGDSGPLLPSTRAQRPLPGSLCGRDHVPGAQQPGGRSRGGAAPTGHGVGQTDGRARRHRCASHAPARGATRARSRISDSAGIPKSAVKCESCVVLATEDGDGTSLQPGSA
jgi:hypothetical protein